MDATNLDEILRRFRTIDTESVNFETRQAKTAASSELAYSASKEYFRKRKDRHSLKNAWEFLMLRTWQDVLETHSLESDVSLSAPTPHAAQEDAVIMQYLTAPNATLLNHLKKGVRPGLPYDDLRVEAALVIHAGALCGVKEAESLLHRDFQIRHLLFSYTQPALYVIDVENSRQGYKDEVNEENAQFKKRLERHTQGRLGRNNGGQLHTFDSLFEQGYRAVKKEQILPDVVRRIEDEYDISVDVQNYRIALR